MSRRFEPYDRQARGAASPGPAKPADVRIRTAVPDDIAQLAGIEAEREGRPAVSLVSKIGTAIQHAAAGRGLILVAEHDGRLTAFAKASVFSPAADAPANTAPPGWYLSGVIVVPEYRRRGIGRRLTQARLGWIGERASRAFYFTNARNQVSIDLHRDLGFVEVTRDFTFPGVTFEGGSGILFMTALPLLRARTPGS